MKLVSQKIIPEMISGKTKAYSQSYQQECWEWTYPGKPFDKRLMADGFTPMKRAIRSFLALHRIESEMGEDELKVPLLEELRTREAIDLYGREWEKGESISSREVLASQDLENLLRFNLESHNSNWSGLISKEEASQYLLETIRVLQASFRLRELRFAAGVLHHRKIKTLEKLSPLPNLLEDAYRVIVKGFAQPISLEEWEQITSLTSHPDFPAHAPEGRELLGYALNHGISLQADPVLGESVSSSLFALYKQVAQEGLLHPGGTMVSGHYLNLCLLACELGEIEWAREFTESESPNLDSEGQKEQILHFNLALIDWYSGDHDAALNNLYQARPGPRRQLTRYNLEMKIHSEMDQDAGLRAIDALLHFLGRTKTTFPGNTAERDRKRALLVRKILKAAPISRDRKASLAKLISKLNFDRKWLMKLLDQYSK